MTNYLNSGQTPQVIASTERWLVLFKPAGWLTIPGRNQAAPVVSEWAKQKICPIWVVHRLDLETSGVLLMARSAEAHRQANSWFQNREIKKIYHCLAKGRPSAPVFKIIEPISGVSARTQVEVRESYREGFLGRILPQTGRRHQIRIHLASQGFPILGDTLYQGPETIELGEGFSQNVLKIDRVALHASSLRLPTEEYFEAPLAEDFESWLKVLRSGTPSLKGGQVVSR